MKKKILSFLRFFLIIGLVIISNYSCDPTTEKPKQLAVLTTKTITDISYHSAVCGGIITSDNGLEVTVRGVCWSLKPNPTINDSITKDAAGTGEFTSNISNLIADTTYYLRAYATNSDGTAYGLQITFKTLATALPTLSTTIATNITETTASSGGDISSDGGSEITARGVCWSLTENPTISNDKTNDGVGVGNFTSNLTNLTDGTTYYLRAYATNSIGTSYGEQISFKTLSLFPTNGLVAWYPFNGNANDESGNGNNGTVNGATLTTDRFEKTNSAYYFSGANNLTRIDAQINTSSIDISHEYSLSIWIKKIGNGSTQPRILEFFSNTNGALQLNWDVAGTNFIEVETINSTGVFQATSYYSTIWLNNWNNIVFTAKTGLAKLYLNGVLVNSFTFNGLPSLATNVSFGRMNHPSYNAINGALDDIGIWNRALNQEEITQIYNFK